MSILRTSKSKSSIQKEHNFLELNEWMISSLTYRHRKNHKKDQQPLSLNPLQKNLFHKLEGLWKDTHKKR